MLTIKAMTGAETYAANHLRNNDYYAVGETVAGQWMGHGAELLGLEGEVKLDDFEAIRQGINPATGEFLRQRHSADRYGQVERNGILSIEKLGTARNLYDFTISAPKALSVQALEDPRLITAHNLAISETAREIESLAGSYVRKNGASGTRPTSNLVMSRWDHDTSRELDPQIHTHLVAANLTYDGAESRWKALAAYDVYQHREYLTEIYRNSLAREVARLGYEIENRFQHGKDYGFSIAGIQEATLEKYSQRSAQRDRAIADFLDKNGRLPSNNEIARLVRDSRPEKLTEITTTEVKARQLARLSPEEAQTLTDLRQGALKRGSIHQQAPAGPSLAYAKEHVFERASVAKDHELNTEALRHGRGRLDLAELKTEILAETGNGAMIAASGELATQESLDRERQMVHNIDQGRGQFERLGRGRDFVVSNRLTAEQKTAVRAVLESRDFAYNVSGSAGVGKTHLLSELQRGLIEARRSVVAVAPTATAVEELQKVGCKDAVTIARLLADPAQRERLRGQVLIVDEAGMVGSKAMAELIGLAKDKGARIVYVGDSAQIKSVEAGDALRVLERESALQTVSVRQIQRQTQAEYKSAIEALRANPAEGFNKLQSMGAIREVDWRLRAQEVSQAYRDASAVVNREGAPRSVLVVAKTHEELSSITYAIRQERKSAGEIECGEAFIKHSPLNWTEAQKKQTKNYQPGEILVFHKAVKGISKNEVLEVVNAESTAITARKQNGETVKITGKQAKAFGVFEKQEIEVSAGDKLLFEANWRSENFRATNGELVTVASVKVGVIRLEDGRELPAEYRQLSHGYAITANRSQAKTVDAVVVLDDGMPRDKAYVAYSRGRESLHIITSDIVGLQESLGVSGDRQSAIELARRADTAKRLDDSWRFYQAQQLTHKPARQKRSIQKEITHHVNERQHAGIGMGI